MKVKEHCKKYIYIRRKKPRRLYFSTKAVNIHCNFLLPNCRRLCSFLLNLIQIFELLIYKIIIGFVKYSLWYRYPLPGINLQWSYLLKQLVTTFSFLWLLLGLTTVLGDCDNAVTMVRNLLDSLEKNTKTLDSCRKCPVFSSFCSGLVSFFVLTSGSCKQWNLHNM